MPCVACWTHRGQVRHPRHLHVHGAGLGDGGAASWLSKHFTYWWLEQHTLGRVLIDTDGL